VETPSVLLEVVAVAREYCRSVEQLQSCANNSAECLRPVTSVLPHLHAAMEALGEPPSEAPLICSEEYEVRFDLFAQLKDRLGERDAYWLEFDQGPEAHEMTGSLADDLTDIYFGLKGGLDLLARNPQNLERAVREWHWSYWVHWGQHLMDAQRHLYDLRRRKELPF
jgi:hypothetical protein